MAATSPSDSLPEAPITGLIERVEGNRVHGWAFDSARPDQAVQVGVRAGRTCIGSGVADRLRTDLQRAGFGQGCHGFSIEVRIPFYSGQRIELELFDTTSGSVIAAVPFTLHCRDPLAVQAEELDSRSLHGLAPRRRSRNRRRLDAVVSPVLKPIRRIRKHYQARAEPRLPAGAQAKLARLDSCSITTLASLEHWPLLSLPEFDPENRETSVSIIIPAHNQFQLTYQCLTSLVLSGDRANVEIIVVDDASTDATSAMESRVLNLRVIRNEQNLGFLHSCNKAASMARGNHIVFLNNDTEVEAGWIDRMLEVFERFSGVGAVGAKLIYPDGSLQDAGGIVWDSGTPWNVGHGRQSDDPEFNYVREVDYLTGAALMVSRDAWNAVGGFSEQYAPAYYEDTDLSFKLRAAGYRTLYCPQATVVHYEGRSHGTDTASGVKQHQLVNAEHFKATWKAQFAGRGTEGVNLGRHKDRNRGLRVLMVDNGFPRLGQDAGSYAAIQELKLLLALGCKVTFLPHNLLHLGVHVNYLQQLGVECVHAPFHRSIQKFMERRAAEFDAVYVTRYVVAEKIIPLVRQYSEARIIFNNADLHFLREMRTAWVSGQEDLSAAEETRRRELAVMKSADAVLSYSDVEIEIIASHILDRHKLFRCPWVLQAESSGKPVGKRSGITFLGGFGHPPNREAVTWFVEHVMPLLMARRPTLRFHVWGSHMPEDSGWDRQEGVVLEGYAKSLDDVFTETLAFVAPLQAGAGIKGKVLDSLAYGVPTVLSPVAAEATGLVDGRSTLIAHSPEQWVSHIERLLDDQALWEDIRANAVELRDRCYSRASGVAAMQGVFDNLKLDTTVAGQQVEKR
ncbi:glycosyltransferase [Granulosicoccus sp. 3-233]